MPQVSVFVNGRNYSLACDEGEEEHLTDLARYLDKRVDDVAGSVGQVGDVRLLLMTGLLVADELSEMMAKVDDLEAEIERLKAGRHALVEKTQRAEAQAAELLELAARRMEDIAGRLEAS